MEKNASNHISYFIELPKVQKEDLGTIRHWSNLKIGFEETSIWISNFTAEQIDEIAVKSIPAVKRYYAKDGKLFPYNSKLPARNEPSLLWSPMERGLPIDLPRYNHNYFGIADKLSLELVPSEEEQKAIMMMVSLKTLESYVQSAPAIRLQALKWLIIDNEKALLFGQPLLPIQGDVYWEINDFVIPVGFKFDLELLVRKLNQKINPTKKDWLIWNKDTSYFKVKKSDFKPLSISSLRQSQINITNN